MSTPANPLPSQNTDQILARTFTGRPVGRTPTFGQSPVAATVVSSTPTEVVVTLDAFDQYAATAGFTCSYEPRWYWNGSANVQETPPPKGVRCLVFFPASAGGFVIAFTGWPTH